ncbi:hypothetical protein GGX14DRAFT_156330 [Mycena pura]|uniref:Uncharacterized protein n=1 Tax=Mycena pura TaxID=153505 RepID=A0AAD6Y6K5_9AGAR|nr:hypothetical protein GGX14DRAFT_156330 [Mycena pura]
MKCLTSLVLSAALVASAFAQIVHISAPADGATVHAGDEITVEVDQPDSLSSSTPIAIVFGFQPCGTSQGSCTLPLEGMGTTILYNGPFKPAFHNDGKEPSQNFTFTIPATAPTGPAQLNLAHFQLMGAINFVLVDPQNITLNVV